MYPGITLYPNGAFMLCESISEFDQNVQPPVVPEEQAVQAMEAIQCHDPVIKVINSLRPIYEREINYLLSTNPEFEDPNEAIGVLETVCGSASTITSALQKMLGKLSGLIDSFRCYGNHVYAPFNSHLGYFMKSAATVRQQGIEQYNYEYTMLPAFNDTWYVNCIISAYCNTPEVFDKIVYGDSLQALTGEYNRFSSSFDGLIDFIRCMFENPERMARLETRETGKLQFRDLLSNNTYYEGGCEKDCSSDGRNMSRRFFCTTSTLLRQSCQMCYDTICKITSEEMTPDVFTDRVRPLMTRWVNIFAIGMMLCMSYAYKLRVSIAEKGAVSSYTSLLIQTLKTV